MMTTTVTLTYEGAPACQDCQRLGVPVCDHVGFTMAAWDHLRGQRVHVPALDRDPAYDHVVRDIIISQDRKHVVFTVDTRRPPLRELARHLSVYGDPRCKAHVRAVHVDTGEVIEEGHYDRPLRVNDSVCVDATPYHVTDVAYPHRDPDTGIAVDDDLQVATLTPIPIDTIRPAL